MIRHRHQRDDRTAVANHRAGKPMTRPCRRDRIRTTKPRGKISRGKTVACGSGIDNGGANRLGFDELRVTCKPYHAGRLGEFHDCFL